jgi:lipopolysaccharide export system ATP-binding protein
MKLRAENLIKTYKGRSSKGISVEVNQGEIVGLLDLTVPEKQLFYMIVGLVKPNSGIYFWTI